MEKLKKAALPALVEKRELTVFTDPAHTMEIRWPETFAMALFDFKAVKKASSWTTYEVALRDFFGFLEQIGVRSPNEVTRTHLTSYIDYLKGEDKADRTIRLYCTANSSFFEFLARPMDTKGTSIIKSNPWKSIREALPRVQAYEKVDDRRELSVEEYQAILRTCDRSTLIGKRDYAIISLAFYTIRRRQEIARLRVRDFGRDGNIRYAKFLNKGSKIMRIDFTPPIWTPIEDYWTSSGRKLDENSPAWVATTDAGKYLPKGGAKARKPGSETPLAPSSIDKMIKSRGNQAGIDTEKVTVHLHGLRHLGARTLRASGMDIKDIKERLGHSKLNTTDVYLGSMDHITVKGLEGFEKIALGTAQPGT